MRSLKPNAPSLAPYAAALADYHRGQLDAQLMLRSSLGEHDTIPVEVFFREPENFFPFDDAALDACHGRILDAGAGTGIHTLALRALDFNVTAIDILPECVEIMKGRGIPDARVADMFHLGDERYDTVLLLMNGIGPVGTLAGLERFLERVPRLLTATGQLIVDSGAAHPTTPPAGAPAIHWPSPASGYAGEAWIQLEYGDLVGAPFQELYVDAGTFRQRAEARGLSVQIIYQGDMDEYVARVQPGMAR